MFSVSEWINIIVINSYNSMKRNDLLMYATTWMYLRNIMLKWKKARHKRVQTVWFHLYEILGQASLNFHNIRFLSGCLGPGVRWKRYWLQRGMRSLLLWWKCSASWLGLWLYWCVHLSKNVYTLNCTLKMGALYCM